MSYAMIQDNYAIALDELDELEESERYHLRAVDLYAALAKKNPVRARLSYARSLHNTACLYQKTKRYEKAEALFLDAIRIREEERLLNPHAVEPLLSGSYWSIGNLYMLMKEDEKAIAAYESAYKMRLSLRRRSAVYGKELYNAYYKLFTCLKDLQRTEEAKALTRRYVDLVLGYEEWASTEQKLMPHLLYDLAEQLMEEQSVTEAMRYAMRALDCKEASNVILWLSCRLLAYAHSNLGNAEDAEKYLALCKKYND